MGTDGFYGPEEGETKALLLYLTGMGELEALIEDLAQYPLALVRPELREISQLVGEAEELLMAAYNRTNQYN